MDAPVRDLLPTLAAILALSLTMVVVMVRFSRALIARSVAASRPVPPGDPDRVSLLGALYLLLWAGIVGAFVHLFRVTGEPLAGRSLALLLGVPAAYLAVHAGLLAFARALALANARSQARAARRRAGAADEPEPHEQMAQARLAAEAVSEEIRSAPRRVAAEAATGSAATATAPAGPSARAPRSVALPAWRRALNLLLTVAAVLILVALGEILPPLRDLTALLARHRDPLVAVALGCALLGVVLLAGGGAHLALTAGTPMRRREREEMQRRLADARRGPAAMRRSSYRLYGEGLGAQGEDQATFAEVKLAWRIRAWQISPRWRRLFAMAAGAALALFGLCGLLFVVAPAGIKLLAAGVAVYAVVQTARGFARA